MPVLASRTTTPTGVMFTRVSRSARARCSSRCRSALAMAIAAWEANISTVSSSSGENAPPSGRSATVTMPMFRPRWRIGAPRKPFTGPRGGPIAGRPSDARWAEKSVTLRGADSLVT